VAEEKQRDPPNGEEQPEAAASNDDPAADRSDAPGTAAETDAAPTPLDIEGPATVAPGETASDREIPDAAAEADARLGVDDLEALLTAVEGKTRGGPTLDDSEEGGPITQDVLDALIAEMTALEMPAAPESVSAPSFAELEDDEPLDDKRMEDALTAPGPEAVTEPPSAALPPVSTPADTTPAEAAVSDAISAPSPDDAAPVAPVAPTPSPTSAEDAGLLSQADLDALIEQALKQDSEPPSAEAPPPIVEGAIPETAPEPTREAAPKSPAHKPPGAVGVWIQQYFPRLAASLIVGLMAAMGTFTLLYRHQEQVPDLAALGAPEATQSIEEALVLARECFAAGAYGEAVQMLDEALATAPPGAPRVDAAYLRVEARYRLLSADAARPDLDAVITEIDRAVEGARTHAKAPEALAWKAELYERMGNLSAAQAGYEHVVAYYADAPNADAALFHAARIALARKEARDSVDFARRLLQQFPNSPRTDEAEMLIADAYALTGMTSEARTLYARTAQEVPSTPMGAQAYLRLGEMALRDGDFEAAIRYFESRLRTATTTAGNDRVHLQLARAYRAAGRIEDARNTLNDLINFFPVGEVTPHAFVELSQVLDALGRRDEAVQLALQSAARFRDNPAVLRNAGELLGLAGRPGPAAEMLVAADEAGAGDPALLIAAGRHFRTAGRIEEAFAVYERVRSRYPRAPQAVTGGIEGAAALYDLGRVSEAVDRLETLAKTTAGTPHHLAAVTGLTRIYQALGLRRRVTELAQELAGASSEPEILAQAALDLFRADAVDAARQLSERIDLTRLKNDTAYALLTAEGAALTESDPLRAVEKLETAALSYADARKPEGDVALLRAYLRTDRRAAARRVVMELDGHVRAQPVDAPWLAKAAVVWGDHLLSIGDAREAANAYALVADIDPGPGGFDKETQRNLDWAKFQRANALLALRDYASGLSLLEEIARSTTPWAAEAALKAEYARVEQRLRGATPPRGQG